MMKTYRGLQCGPIGGLLGRMVKLAVVAWLLTASGPPPKNFTPPTREQMVADAMSIAVPDQASLEAFAKKRFSFAILDPDPTVTFWNFGSVERIVYEYGGMAIVCGSLKSKNKFGGYTDFMPFIVMVEKNGRTSASLDTRHSPFTPLPREICPRISQMTLDFLVRSG